MVRFLKYLLIIAVIILLLFKTGSYVLRKSVAETYRESISEAPFDVIIVPGIPYDSANPNKMMKARMFWAKNLYEKGVTRNIIFSGDAVHSPYIEGKCMKIIADSMGIPADKTFSESKALHGTENIELGMELARTLGFKKMAIATDPFQFAYLRYYEKRTIISYLPMPVDCMKTYDRPLPAIDTRDVKVDNFVPLKER
jgi:hypothetical protein